MSAPLAVGSPPLLAEIAAVAVDGGWRRGALADRLDPVLGAQTADRVAGVLLEHFPRLPWGTVEHLAAELAALPALEHALAVPATAMPITPRSPDPVWRWPVAPWATVEQLAHGLDLDVGELAWLADLGGWLRRRPRASDGDGGRRASRLRHYRYRWHTTSSGRARLLEAPKPLLAERQRRVARRVLAAMPVHPAAHGFVPGRSVTSFAAPHAAQGVVVRIDLEGFFTTITAARVRGLLATAGYPEPVARLLAGLLTTATPIEVLHAAPTPTATGPTADAAIQTSHRQRLRLAAAHLPQGAPSSPATANLLAFGLDRRLTALAASRGLSYTRYADDLAFSGPADTDTIALRRTVARIVTDQGFRPHPTKTRVMAAHRQQRLTGLVVNAHPAVPRLDYDQLRAILHNATVTGPAAQNHHTHPDFAAHLRGRIAWVAATHPGRAAKLLALYDRIDWNS